ncbi:MAG: VWA domain-containing protein [Bryobacteraceae bacterium]|jgi:VWFA-related protein
MQRGLLASAIALCACVPAARSEGSHAKLIRLNVAALDAHGQPATGLRSADFQLFEDGKRQDVAFFRFTGDQSLEAKPGPGEYSNRAAARWRATVVLIDMLADRIMSDSVISRDVDDFWKHLESSEGLYLYILTARGDLYPIHPLPKPDTEVTLAAEPWTRNIVPLLQAALVKLAGIRPVDDRDIKYRYEMSMNALRDLGSRMAVLSGRKNLVWITGGLPLIGYSVSLQSDVDFTNPLRWFCEELEQAQIVVSTVAQSLAGAGAALETYHAESLDQVTSLTGGREYGSDSAGGAIRQASVDSRANYEIAYYPPLLKLDGKHHKLKVICGREEVRLQTVQGFYALAPLVLPAIPAPAELRSRDLPREVEAAAHSPFDATEIGLRASVSPDSRFEVHIDAADLMPRSTRNPDAGKVWVAFVAYGETLKPLPHPTLITLTPEQFQSAPHGDIELRESIPIAPATRKVRVIAFDAELNAVGSVTIPMRH